MKVGKLKIVPIREGGKHAQPSGLSASGDILVHIVGIRKSHLASHGPSDGVFLFPVMVQRLTFYLLEEEFPVHLPVGFLEDVPDEAPAELGVRVEDDLGRDAVRDDENHQDHHEERQVYHL